ncbi:MAG: TylF/MycF/NovP-related O-methyltransferase [Solirubrobacterales bacterium]
MVSGTNKGEILDAIVTSKVGRLLEPMAQVTGHRQANSLRHEYSRMLTLAWNFVRSEKVEGDYAEFGTYTGRTFVESWRIAAVLGEAGRRRLFAFDSFEGLPQMEGIDDTGRWDAGDFGVGRRDFEARLRRARIPRDHVHIVEGFYDKSLAEPERIPLGKVSIAWVDCDLYASTVPVLEFLTPRLAQGSILLFDDWFCFKGDPERGEQRACREWLERNPELSLINWRTFTWSGQAFIVRRAGDDS